MSLMSAEGEARLRCRAVEAPKQPAPMIKYDSEAILGRIEELIV